MKLKKQGTIFFNCVGDTEHLGNCQLFTEELYFFCNLILFFLNLQSLSCEVALTGERSLESLQKYSTGISGFNA